MTNDNNGFVRQVRRNSVALISLLVALSSLAYNTWRNEQTEENRNQRHAAFEVLLKLNDLQQVIFHSHYDKDRSDKGNPRTGWAHVLTVRDLSRVLHDPVPARAEDLRDAWSENWEGLGRDQQSADSISQEIDAFRNAVLALIDSLE